MFVFGRGRLLMREEGEDDGRGRQRILVQRGAGQGGLGAGVAHHHDDVGLEIAGRGRVVGGFQQPRDFFLLDRLGGVGAHRAAGVDQLEKVHSGRSNYAAHAGISSKTA